jgi:DNA-directed RNA polymerase II subunit RPB2
LEKEIDAIHLKKSTLEVIKEFIPVIGVVGKRREEENKLEKGGNEIEKTIKQMIQFEKQEKKHENEKKHDENDHYENQQGEPETKFGDEIPEEDIKQGIFAEYPNYIQEAPIITDAYYKIQPLERLVRHQLESFNYFIHFQAHQTIQMFNPLVARIPEDLIPGTTDKYFLEIQVTVKNMRYQSPQIYETNGATKLLLPSEARLRNFTYASNTTVDLEIVSIERNGESEIVRTQNNVIPNVSITEMPIMVKSSLCMLTQNRHIGPEYTGECPMDCGGYFIIKGSEKAVLGQERAAENKIYCFDGKNTAKWQWVAEIKSVPDFKCVSPKQVEMMVSKKDNGYGYGIFVCIPKLKPNYSVELFVLFRALGVLSDKEICETILLNVEDEKQSEMLEFLHASVIDANRILTQEDAIRHLMSMVSYVPMMTTQNSSTFHSVGGGLSGGPSKKDLASAIGGGGGALDIGGSGFQGMDEEKRKEWAAYGFRKKHEFTTELLNNDLFPHCRTTKQKIYMLGYMAQRLIYIGKGWSKADNRDSYLNKRIDLPGISLNNLFRNYYHRMTKDMIKAVNKEIKQGTWRSHDDVANIINKSNIYKIVKPATIKTGMIRALATGDFSTKQANSNKVGVAQVLNRLTYQATLSHLRRINTPVDKSSEMIDPRKLHGTQWGFLCPIETPEGSSIGLVKNLSSHTHITIPGNSSSLYEYVRPYVTLIEDAVTPRELYGKAKVFINGVWMGVVKSSTEGGRSEVDAIALYKSLKDKKSKGIINIYTSIYFDYIWGEIRLCNDGGRLTRPVLRVRDGKVLITPEIVRKLDMGELSWNDLLTNCKLEESVVEYIDPEEQYYSMITMHPTFLSKQMGGGILGGGKEGGIMGREDSQIYDQKKEREREIDTIRNERFITACEIHPQTLLGILASCIPFPEHNPAARDIYQTAMAKQAMGFGALNYDQRMEKTAYVLNSPTRPLVDTRLMNSIHLDRMPAGCQVHVAIMTYTGYNQEDSIILNEGAIKRGLFSTTVYHTEKDEDNNVVRDEIIRSKPNPEETKGMKFANYEKLGKNGFVPPNTKLENRDVLIAKVFPIKENRADSSKKIKYEDQSKVFRSTEPAYVDRNLTGRNGDGANFGKTTIRIYRPPVIGDKFASRSAQKGTTGLIIPEADMPFTREGVKPDIILNPHAIPSRMTISHIKETLLGKVLIELGMFGDGTAFSGLDVGTICSALQELGYESHGNEVLYDGLTGEQIETSIFLGPVFYQRLKHMVNDKQHSRSVGVVVNFTRQPAEGRSREGGFRVGEMEKDVLVAHGGSKFFRERMYDMSDKYGLYVCKGCGMYGAVNEGEGPWNRGALGSKANPDFKQYLCKTCDNRSDFSYVEVPYCFKLLQQELQAMNVGMRLITE